MVKYMKIKQIVVGLLKENCYIVTKNNKSIIIDPGDETEKIEKEIEGELIGILITHHHFDHIGALNNLLSKYEIPVIDYNNQSILKPFNYEIIKNPGHTKDSISFYFKEEKVMFCGDFVFKDTIGRTDLTTGNISEMKESIKNLLKLDKNIILYPGHYEKTSIKEEKENLENIVRFY